MEWINIAKQTPKEGQLVLIYFECTGVDIMKYHNLKGTKDAEFGTHLFTGSNGFLTDDVTHWMPLPKKPSREDE